MTAPTLARIPAPIPAIVLAGSRPGPDPLLSGRTVSTKALLPVAGRPMLAHVVAALRASPHVGAVTILAQTSAELAADPALPGFADQLGSAACRDIMCPYV